MKRPFLITAVILLMLVSVFILFKFTKVSNSDIENVPTSTLIPSQQTLDIATLPHAQAIEATFNNQQLIIYALKMQEESSLTLIPNFEENLSGQRLAQANKCDLAINGGFYKTNREPLGLFLADGQYLGRNIKSNLINGYFWQDISGERFISWQLTEDIDKLDFAFQSGPLIKVRETNLVIRDDEQARRALLGVDQKGNLYLIVVVEKDNNYLGPYLADVPKIFNKEIVKSRLTLDTLLNLDGGSASFFYVKKGDKKFVLSELVSIGSLICVKSNIKN